jgi:hypothetical protein
VTSEGRLASLLNLDFLAFGQPRLELGEMVAEVPDRDGSHVDRMCPHLPFVNPPPADSAPAPMMADSIMSPAHSDGGAVEQEQGNERPPAAVRFSPQASIPLPNIPLPELRAK